ncbi:Ca2+-transporting ATPase [Deinobacterium chartae]|uniref:Ca2+-transporting ATPase n=1 Tax=Deinobacterium chartae TaxID=521158 RepID=A0A841HVL3_9DEIO|nr:HAD-IC family P-type ATPase [Deinobacterium chartae]MBB6096704.1 Ca2+-transporting ATPase [Deinobacterium chartae]
MSASVPRSPQAPKTARPWHALEGREVLQALGSREEGLEPRVAAERLEALGHNVLSRRSGPSALRILWRQLQDPLIYVLLGSSLLAILLGKGTDGLVVLAVVVLNTLIGFVQEYRASRAIASLSEMVPLSALVLRAGERLSVSTAELVPGDVVLLSSGDAVAADMRLLSGRTLQVVESALTGESIPVPKRPEPLPEGTPVADRLNMLYSGTLVTQGAGMAVVVETGERTELGRINALLGGAEETVTPLTRQLGVVGNTLTLAILVLAVVLLAVGLGRGYSLPDAALAGITLAVGAVPEGLPAVVTIALAIGVSRMARRRAIIRRLPAVETLGSTSVICSDKTGTLTRNEMTVRALWAAGRRYRPDDREDTDPTAELTETALTRGDRPLEELLRAGVLCNDAGLRLEDGRPQVSGDPTEGALLLSALSSGLDPEALRRACPRLAAIEFESERQYMATLHGGARPAVYLKGAPEAVLARCDLGAAEREEVLEEVGRLAGQGMRVLALAGRDAGGLRTLEERDVAGGLRLLGLQGMIDPPRPEALRAVREAHAAGISVKMITGDHAATAQAIGEQLGLGDRPAVSGARLAEMSDTELDAVVREANVFARVAPEHKLRLVRALQAQGRVVAMTGDGVNDAPALKQADIGIAMGITGTAVSKDAADVVLTDDNFATITAAVEEGRRVYDNLVKSLAFLLPTNLGLAMILAVAVAFFPIRDGEPVLPMQPTQLLWINMVAAVALGVPLAFEAHEPGLMRRPPRRQGAPLISRFVLLRTVMVAVLMTCGALAVYLYEAASGDPQAALRGQSMAVTTVIAFQVFYLLNCRSLEDSLLRIGLWSNPAIFIGIGAVIALQAAFLYLPALQTVFGTVPLGVRDLSISLLVGFMVFPIVNLEKALRRQAHAGQRGT